MFDLPRIPTRALALLAGSSLFLAALGPWGCDGSPAAPGDEIQASADGGEPLDAIAVKVDRVRRGSLSALYETSATLRAEARAVVTARTRGVVRELLVEEGDRVEANQPVAILEDDEQKIIVARTEAVRDIRQSELERCENLCEQGVLSDNEMEVARREAEESRHAAALARLELERTLIHAPFEGTILVRSLDVGATVSDGTSVYELADIDPLYADVNVPERSVARLHKGQSVRLLGDVSGTSGEAIIERIAPLVDPSTGTVKVTLAVSGSGELRPGSFVRVQVVTDTRNDVLVVKRSALVADGRRWHLYRLREDGKTVEMLEVVPGYEEGDRVEVREVLGGFELGTDHAVVVAGASALTDGAKVEITWESAGGPASQDGEPAAVEVAGSSSP